MTKLNKKILIIIGSGALLIILIIILGIIFSRPSKEKHHRQLATYKEMSLSDMIKMQQNKNTAFTEQQSENDSIPGGTDSIYQNATKDAIRLQNEIKKEVKSKLNNSKSNYTSITTPLAKIETKKTVKPVKKDSLSTIRKKIIDPEESFFSEDNQQEVNNAYKAVVHGEQTVTNGGRLKLRLLDDMPCDNGIVVPKNTYLYGIVNISAERIEIKVGSIKIGNSIYEIKRTVYDQEDGIEGINTPSNVRNEILKQSESRAVEQQPEMSSSNIIARTANSVANTVSSIISRNVNIIRVTIKSNYKVLLK